MMFTDYGINCDKMMRKYSKLHYYYDDISGSCVIPIEVVENSTELHKEILGILSEPHFKNADEAEMNWALEVFNYGEQVCICIRDVESYC